VKLKYLGAETKKGGSGNNRGKGSSGEERDTIKKKKEDSLSTKHNKKAGSKRGFCGKGAGGDPLHKSHRGACRLDYVNWEAKVREFNLAWILIKGALRGRMSWWCGTPSTS